MSCAIFGTSTASGKFSGASRLLVLLLAGVRINSSTDRGNSTPEIQVEFEDEVLKFLIAHTSSKAPCADLNVQVEMFHIGIPPYFWDLCGHAVDIVRVVSHAFDMLLPPEMIESAYQKYVRHWQ